ncbi:MAG: primosomal protein N' [Alphaproteobacteria bacterium]|nr:primosomal protein N' [Alphaproteobacteria bacterium]
MDLVDVVLPQRLTQAYTYVVPESLSCLEPGQFVKVPFGTKEKIGLIWQRRSKETYKGDFTLKEVSACVDAPALPHQTLSFARWVSDYTVTPLGLVLKMIIPQLSFLDERTETYLWTWQKKNEKRLTPLRLKIKTSLEKGMIAQTLTQLANHLEVSTATLKALEKEGMIEKVPTRLEETPICAEEGILTFNGEQARAVHTLQESVRKEAFQVTLLDGVTGSGKTEVYQEAVFEALGLQKQVLILLPEIALTPQGLARFERRFGQKPLLWHSGVSEGAKAAIWQKVIRGTPCVVIGARSALFLPFSRLGLVVVDEEHEHAYKQEQGVMYHARDMAVVRAHLEKIPVILASATPSVESLVNVAQGKYQEIQLTQRYARATLPLITLVDRRKEPLQTGGKRWIGDALYQKLQEALEAGQQSLLFLNRRGYAPLTLCRRCGERLECPSCASFLVEHRTKGILMCHQCGHTKPTTTQCPSCGGEDCLVACGPGVERLKEEINRLLPLARVGVITSDQGSVKERAQQLRAMEKGEIDILIGTQMIAKGHHFPGLTFVGVVDGDLGLCGGDLRAGERTYQLLHQVAGRCGREERKGHVMIQTYAPDHPVMQALSSGNRADFMDAEIEARQHFQMPPFSRLVGLIFSGPDEGLTSQTASMVAAKLAHTPKLVILGPCPAPLSRVGGQYRWRLLIKAEKSHKLQRILEKILKEPHSSKVRIQIDVDPYSFL